MNRLYREGDDASAASPQRSRHWQGRVDRESILGKGSSMNQVTETNNAGDDGGNEEQFHVGLALHAFHHLC